MNRAQAATHGRERKRECEREIEREKRVRERDREKDRELRKLEQSRVNRSRDHNIAQSNNHTVTNVLKRVM